MDTSFFDITSRKESKSKPKCYLQCNDPLKSFFVSSYWQHGPCKSSLAEKRKWNNEISIKKKSRNI